MHALGVSFLTSLGASPVDAWELTSMAKHGPLAPLQASQKHVTIARLNGWMDRISAAAASLQLGGSGFLTSEELKDLAIKSGHTQLIQDLEDEKKKLVAPPAARKEAFITCKCKSTDVDIDQRQTRSSDEPMTLFALCRTCGSSWVVRDGAGLGSIG